MSMYDNSEKDELYFYISQFLKNHNVSELLDMVATAVKYEKEDDKEDNICPNCGFDMRYKGRAENG